MKIPYGYTQSINQYSFNKSMAERKLINNRKKRHAKYMLYQKCQYNEMPYCQIRFCLRRKDSFSFQ